MRRAKERSRQNFAVVLGFVERAVRSLPDQKKREREDVADERERERERKETTSSRGFCRKNTSSSSSSNNTNNKEKEKTKKTPTKKTSSAAAHLLNLPHLDVLLMVVAHGRHLCLLFCVYLLKNNVIFGRKLSSFFSLKHTVLGLRIMSRKRSIRTVLPQKVIVPDAFSHFVKELIVWSPERFRARKKHPAARSIDRGTRPYVFVKVHAPKRSRRSCKCDS